MNMNRTATSRHPINPIILYSISQKVKNKNIVKCKIPGTMITKDSGGLGKIPLQRDLLGTQSNFSHDPFKQTQNKNVNKEKS